MKTKTKTTAMEDMLPEYDLAGMKGVRGKYYRAYRRGHTVRIQKADGAVSVQYFTLQDGAIMLEPDVKRHFPNSESVNKALRSLISAPRGKQPRHKAVSKER
ncbi:MAG: hypothetical protein AABN34_07655 [Acidobacteriota bacterium]